MREYICKNCGKRFMTYRKKAIYCSKSCSTKNIWTGRKHTEKTKQKMRKSEIWQKLEEVVNLYNSGKTCKEIADLMKFNINTLKGILKRNGIKFRKNPKLWIKGQMAWNKDKKCPQTSGKKNGNYKGGITPLNQKIRHCLKYKQWIETIFKRDNWICQICEKRGGNLEADHYPKKFCDILKDNNIKSLEEAENCEELWNLNNGRTICLKCHNRTKQVRSRFKKLGIT